MVKDNLMDIKTFPLIYTSSHAYLGRLLGFPCDLSTDLSSHHVSFRENNGMFVI